jgi:outer membrane cobalamin receptor
LALEGANVVIGKQGMGTTTDHEGIFYLPNSGITEEIRIQFIGYQSLILTAADLGPNCPIIYLQPESSSLKEVLIRGFLVEGIDRESTGATLINTEHFGLLPGQIENDVLQITQALPGIESVDETISTINIRGGTSDENLIMWEGVRLYQTGHLFGLISALNPAMTQSVSVYKNGTPTRYGEGVSGTIDIRSQDRVTDEFSGSASVNLLNANAFVSAPLAENVNLQLAGRYSDSDLWDTRAYEVFARRIFQDSEISDQEEGVNPGDVSTDQRFTFFDLGAKLLWDISARDKVRLHTLVIQNDLEFDQTLVAADNTITSQLDQSSLLGGLRWERQWSNDLRTTLSAHGSFYQLQGLNIILFTEQEQFQETEVLDTGVQLDASWNLSEQINLSGGYQVSEVGIENTREINLPLFRDRIKEVIVTHVGYGEVNYRSLNGNTRASLGGRLNYFDKFDQFRIEPRFHLIQQLGKGLSAELAGEFKSQSVTQRIDQLNDFLGIERRRWVLANDKDFLIKTSEQASAGLIYQKNDWFVNLEGYIKKVSDISSASQGFQNQFQFERVIGLYEVYGIEFTLDKQYKEFRSWISYNFKENNYEFPTFVPSEFPNNLDIRHSVNASVSYTWNNLIVAGGLIWRSGAPFTQPQEGNEIDNSTNIPSINYDLPNQERLPDYMRLDLSAEYKWQVSEKAVLQFNLALLNILDKENLLARRFDLREVDGTLTVDRIDKLSLGFTPNLAVRFRWN